MFANEVNAPWRPNQNRLCIKEFYVLARDSGGVGPHFSFCFQGELFRKLRAKGKEPDKIRKLKKLKDWKIFSKMPSESRNVVS